MKVNKEKRLIHKQEVYMLDKYEELIFKNSHALKRTNWIRNYSEFNLTYVIINRSSKSDGQVFPLYSSRNKKVFS